jgi:putative N6-adenine-specific DNA methylase
MKKKGLEKRIKRRITARAHPFYAACSPGFKQVCHDEMLAHGFSNEQLTVTTGGIEFTARPEQVMLANLNLRSPTRILMRVAQFRATSFDHLEKKTANIDWEIYLKKNARIGIRVTTRKSRLYHSDAIAQRVKQIIRTHLAAVETIKAAPDTVHTLFIRAENDRFTLSIDTSGDPLFKRGIKKQITPAPLRENIAAAMLYWAGLGAGDVLIDPMCGSGTFSLEAAMIKSGTPPGLYRPFAFEFLPGFSRKTFNHLKKNALSQQLTCNNHEIFASDIDQNAVSAIKKNIGTYDFARMIDVQNTDFFSLNPERLCNSQKGVIVLNPPYGRRLEFEMSCTAFLDQVRLKLLADFKGWRLAIILPSKKEFSLLGLKLMTQPVFHGGTNAFAGIGII